MTAGFFPALPSSCHSTPDNVSVVIWSIVPVIWGDQSWAPSEHTWSRWRRSTCREPERTLTEIFYGIVWTKTKWNVNERKSIFKLSCKRLYSATTCPPWYTPGWSNTMWTTRVCWWRLHLQATHPGGASESLFNDLQPHWKITFDFCTNFLTFLLIFQSPGWVTDKDRSEKHTVLHEVLQYYTSTVSDTKTTV